MSATFKVSTAGILKWAQYLEEAPKRTKVAVAKAINDYGAGVADGTAEAIAAEYDLSAAEVRALIDIREATPQSLRWEMDASQVAPPSQEWERPWDQRSTKDFEKQTLVNIVTMEDMFTCEVCEDASEKSPWAQSEIDEMVAKWKHFRGKEGPAPGTRTNLIHPNCRCFTVPFAQKRRVSVKFGGKGAPTALLTARELGVKVAGEMKVILKVTR